MIAVLSLSSKVRKATKEYFSDKENQELN
jgi:hypothetical protein